MESLILASYVLKTNQGKTAAHPAMDESAHRSARSVLASLTASMVGVAAFAIVLELFR